MSFPATSPQRSPLVFIVDDESLVCMALETAFEVAGYRTRTFTEATNAWEACDSETPKPDLMVADYRMPDMNGGELIQRCCGRIPGLKTILISGAIKQSEVSRLPVAPDHFFAKPFHPQDLLRVVDELLNID
jgi:two-component system, OmpR family, response regulator